MFTKEQIFFQFEYEKIPCKWIIEKTNNNEYINNCLLGDDGIWNDNARLYDNCLWIDSDVPWILESGYWSDFGAWIDISYWKDG